ncbi:hypothetical protein [Pararhodospirillum photometricum]|nr:hypothetical protein [Pararhodospirillum photometricum]
MQFDEEFYLITNPDVANAVKNGSVQSGYEHWISFGAKEGRLPCPVWSTIGLREFDEGQYLKANPDVYKAVAEGDIASGYEHFLKCGWREVEGASRPINERDKIRVDSLKLLSDHVFMMMNANLIKDPNYFRIETHSWFNGVINKFANEFIFKEDSGKIDAK